MGQFSALLLKNWILFKRSWFGSLLQIFIPIAFVVLVFMIRSLAQTTYYNQTQYIDYTYPDFKTYSNQFIGNPTANYGNWLLKNCNMNQQRTGTVALSPKGDPLIVKLNDIITSFGYLTKIFDSDAQLDNYIRSRNYGLDSNNPFICYGVSVESSSGNYKYNLRFNITQDQGSQGPDTTSKSTTQKQFDLYTLTNPWFSGMIQTNTMMLNTILQKQTDSTYQLNTIITPMTQQAYYYDPIYSYLGNSMDFLCLLPLLIVYLRQISSMLSQKQNKVRQTMKIMGMSNFSYYFTWFIRYFITYIIIHIVSSVILWKAFKTINLALIFIVYILFDIILILQAFFIQILFTRAKIGMVIGLLFFLLQYIIHFIVGNSNNPNIQQKTYASISPHSAFISALQQILYANSVNFDFGFETLTYQLNHFALYITGVSYLIHIVFWILLTLYLQEVFPNQWGAKKHPLFCFDWICNWSKSKVYDKVQIQQSRSEDEVLSGVQQVQQKYKQMEKSNQNIKFIKVNKQFSNGRKAVKQLNLNIYKDQIFVLLGHNGAGKTTTISMLTGLLQPSSGIIKTLGYDTKTQMDELRKLMGICPQHDTLYAQLTVQQHLYLFGTFKGYSGQKLKQQVQKLIKDVNLFQKTNYYVKDLSGGQKRRLSVALAFIGGSKLIFLDEPTSGMDTSARRYIWQMMKNYKSDRILILTTHFMDEADFLGDRIGIMAGGKLICAGSSLFLKNKFGVGYNITFVKQSSTISSQPILKLIQKIIPNVKVSSDVSSELSIQLDMAQINNFPTLFKKLDENKKKLNIQSYGVSITTLEQVFLKVLQMNHEADEDDDQLQNLQPGSPQKLSKKPGRISLNTKEQKKYKQYQKTQIPIVENFFRHLGAILLKRLRIVKRDLNTLAFQFIFPILIIIIALLIMRINFISDMPKQVTDLNVFKNQGLPIKLPFAGNDSITLNPFASQISNDYPGLLELNNIGLVNNCKQFDTNYLFPHKSAAQKAGICIMPITNPNLFKYYNIINTKSPVTPLLFPVVIGQSYINYIKSSTGIFGSPITITMTNSPLPKTYYQLQINNAISGFLGAFIFSIALSFKFASIISFVVKERQDRCKHQQIVSGMNIYAYWIGNFIFDYTIYLMVAAFGAGMCQYFNIKGLVQGDALKSTWLLFTIYGLANIPFTYIVSFIFSDYGNSQAGWYFFNFVVGGIVSTVILLLRLISTTTNPIAKILAWILRFFPAYCFGQGLLNSGSLQLLQFAQNKGNVLQVFGYDITLSQLIYLGAEFFGYFILLFFIQKLSNSQNFMRFFSRQQSIPPVKNQYDNDVEEEMAKAQKANPEDYTIVTKNLRKVYLIGQGRHKLAVDHLSFTVQKGEVFGLLGINGAGKTTTFKILSGQLTSTSGDSYFNGLKISQNLDTIRRSLGYCPQFDALLQNLTVRQQLQLYYDMKGLPIQQKTELIDDKIRQLNLVKYINILSGTLSGGNKRKLSVACAIIGDPKIVFLDQPSTGMDPEARRFMWRVINQITNIRKSTVILTTHSMQQAQALSNRLGIMVGGNFKCLGTPQHIKSKYGEGYEIQIKLLNPTKIQISKKLRQCGCNEANIVTVENLKQYLSKLSKNEQIIGQVSQNKSGKYLIKSLKQSKSINISFLVQFILIQQRGREVQKFIGLKLGKKEIIEHFQVFYRYRLKQKLPIGQIFRIFQQNKQRLMIQQYSIKQATVEQIFNKFASNQDQQDL